MHSPAADRLETGFDHLRFFGYLPTHTSLGETLIAARQLESTQTLLQDNASFLPGNTVCIAYQQVGGKGKTLQLSCVTCSALVGKQLDTQGMLDRQGGQQMGLTCWMLDVFHSKKSKHRRYLSTVLEMALNGYHGDSTPECSACRSKSSIRSVHCDISHCASSAATCTATTSGNSFVLLPSWLLLQAGLSQLICHAQHSCRVAVLMSGSSGQTTFTAMA